MKKIIAAATLAITGTAFAQVSNFTGYSAGVNLDHTTVTNKLSITDGNDTLDFDGVGQQSIGATIFGAYGVALDEKSVVNFGATYGLNSAKSGEFKINGDGLSVKVKNQYSLYVEPGLLLSDKTLAYGKISYNKAKAVAEDASGDGSRSISGVGYGFGVRTMIDKNLSLHAEVKRVNYGSESTSDGSATIKTTATVGSIGIGYKF